jgi:hypothetical protein
MNPSVARSEAGPWRGLFLVAGIYDAALGLAFLTTGEAILRAIGMALPPHIAYIHLLAIFILIQGLSYLLVARDPWANVGLAMVGVLYKGAYAGLAAWYLATGQMPNNFFVPWAVFDAAFLVAFLLFIREAGARRA